MNHGTQSHRSDSKGIDEDILQYLAERCGVVLVPNGQPKPGTFALIFSGQRSNLEGPVAVRMSRAVSQSVSREALKRDFEGHNLARQCIGTNSISGLVRVHFAQSFTIDVDNPRYLVVLDWAGNRTLENRIQLSPGGISDARELFRYIDPLADALDFLRANGLAHLDVKPSNVLIHDDGRVQLGDYGSLLQLGHEPAQVEQMLTEPYSAPEVWDGKPHRSSDLYSLARLYYQLRTGRDPRELDSVQTASLPGLGRDEFAVLRLALRKQPEDRPERAVEWAERLRSSHTIVRQSSNRPARNPTIPQGRRSAIGLLGSTGAGKTTLLSMLVHPSCLEGDVRVQFHDESTQRRLKEELDLICDTGATGKTGAEVLPEMEFTLVAPGECWRIHINDYGGALAQLDKQSNTDFEKMSDELLVKLCQCDALLLLVDANDADKNRSPLDALQRLQRRLDKRAAGGPQFPNIALVYTKVDRLVDLTDNNRGSPELIHDNVLSQIRQKLIVRVIRSEIGQFDHQEFVISAFGRPLTKGQKVSIGDLVPYELLRPFHWAAQQATAAFESAHKSASGKLRDEVERLLDVRWADRINPRYRAAMNAIAQFESRFRPDLVCHSKETAEQQAHAVEALRFVAAASKNRRARRNRRVLIALLVFLAAMTWGTLAGVAHLQLAVLTQSTDQLDGEANAFRRLQLREGFLSSKWANGWLIGFKNLKREQIELTIDGQQAELQEYVDVVSERQAHPSDSDASDRVKLLSSLKFPSGKYQNQYAGWLADDRERVIDWQEQEESNQLLEAPLTDGRALDALISQHRQQFARLRDNAKLTAKQTQARTAWFDQALARAKSMRDNNAAISKVLAVCNECISIPETDRLPERTELLAFVAKEKDDAAADKKQYEAVSTELSSINPLPENLIRVRALADSYLNADRMVKAMKTEVSHTSDWLKSITTGTVPATVYVKNLSIPMYANVWNWGQLTKVNVTCDGSPASAEKQFHGDASVSDLQALELEVGDLPVRSGSHTFTVAMWCPTDANESYIQRATVEMDLNSGEAVAPLTLKPNSDDPSVQLNLRVVCPDLDIAAHAMPDYHE